MEEKGKQRLVKGAKITGIAAEVVFIPWLILPFVLLFQWLFCRRKRKKKPDPPEAKPKDAAPKKKRAAKAKK